MLRGSFAVKKFISMNEIIEAGISAVIRPPRVRYTVDSVPSSIAVPGEAPVPRESVRFANPRGHSVVGSLYSAGDAKKCVIYLHGNASCQLEGVFLVPVFCRAGVAVFCFDFAACGMSDGDTISVGWFERDDVAAAIDVLRSRHGIEQFALDGRGDELLRNGTRAGDRVRRRRLPVHVTVAPRPRARRQIRRPGLPVPVRRLVPQAEGPRPRPVRHQCLAPLFVIHGREDRFINPEHSRRIFDAYAGAEKVIEIVSGDHGTPRTAEVLAPAMLFIAHWLGVEIVVDQLMTQIQGANRQIACVNERMQFYRE
jgi:pimeloyl-ACP methyl ester carboxylesterase